MTPDKWVRSPDGQAVVEAMVAAVNEPYGYEDMRVALLAALRVRRMTPCPECGGQGCTHGDHCYETFHSPNCPTCAGAGKVPGAPLLVDALMEPVMFASTVPGSYRGYRVRVPGAAQPEEPR